MDSLYLLIPISIVLVLLIGGILAWAVLSGQFENLEAEGARILDEDAAAADAPSTRPHDPTPARDLD
jgi:cbb3-type cytochrome oxidase maturation protein